MIRKIIINDYGTAKDEAILFNIIMFFFLIGVALMITAPSFWIVDAVLTKSFGLILIITSLMFVPGLIYRLRSNC